MNPIDTPEDALKEVGKPSEDDSQIGAAYEGCMKEFVSFTRKENGTPAYENTFLYALLKKEGSDRRE